ncbi:MAG: GxxExxY protein [Bacteroidota bacterium]
MNQINSLSKEIIGCAIRVHSTMGPGLMEKVYHQCLLHELNKKGLKVQSESPMRIQYDTLVIDDAYRLDLVVEIIIVLEIKAVDELNDLHMAQLLTYLKLGGYPLGLLMNFNVTLLKNGIRRLINSYQPSSK